MDRLCDGVYTETGPQGTNAGLITTIEGAVLVDTLMLPSATEDWATDIHTVAGDIILYLVLTDQYMDHSLSSGLFECPVVAHESAWKEIRGWDDETFEQRLEAHFGMLALRLPSQHSDFRPREPELIVSSELRIHKGNREIRIIHLGGHSHGSLAVFLPEERVLFAGDVVVSGQHPFMGQANTRQWLHALERIRSLDVHTIIPGHGPVCGIEATLSMTEYISTVRTRVADLYASGATRRETVDKAGVLELITVPPDQLPTEQQKVRLGIEHVYAEIRREQTRSRR